jgi:hypothetical protein
MSKSIRLAELMGSYEGPDVVLDFDQDGDDLVGEAKRKGPWTFAQGPSLCSPTWTRTTDMVINSRKKTEGHPHFPSGEGVGTVENGRCGCP